MHEMSETAPCHEPNAGAIETAFLSHARVGAIGAIMPEFSLAWNRRRLTSSRRSEVAPWQLECVLCERVLLEGRLQLSIVARLSGILEDEIDSPASHDQFWYDARRKLGKLRRLVVRL